MTNETQNTLLGLINGNVTPLKAAQFLETQGYDPNNSIDVIQCLYNVYNKDMTLKDADQYLTGLLMCL